jgi:hypothetical protein
MFKLKLAVVLGTPVRSVSSQAKVAVICGSATVLLEEQVFLLKAIGKYLAMRLRNLR